MTCGVEWLQKVIVETLQADSMLKKLLGKEKIYDAPPRGASFPYLCFDETSTLPLTGPPVVLEEHFLTLSVWSSTKGRLEVLRILEALAKALEPLTSAVLSSPGFSLEKQQEEVIRGRDLRSWHGRLRLRGVTLTQSHSEERTPIIIEGNN